MDAYRQRQRSTSKHLSKLNGEAWKIAACILQRILWIYQHSRIKKLWVRSCSCAEAFFPCC